MQTVEVQKAFTFSAQLKWDSTWAIKNNIQVHSSLNTKDSTIFTASSVFLISIKIFTTYCTAVHVIVSMEWDYASNGPVIYLSDDIVAVLDGCRCNSTRHVHPCAASSEEYLLWRWVIRRSSQYCTPQGHITYPPELAVHLQLWRQHGTLAQHVRCLMRLNLPKYQLDDGKW